MNRIVACAASVGLLACAQLTRAQNDRLTTPPGTNAAIVLSILDMQAPRVLAVAEAMPEDRYAFVPSNALIRLAQDAGFTLADVRTLLAGFDDRTPASARWRVMATKKLADVTQRIERAQRMERLLERLVQCRCDTLTECVRSKADALRQAI